LVVLAVAACWLWVLRLVVFTASASARWRVVERVVYALLSSRD
jgi:hypothetical protein